jgi:UTP--glucose-1-phosphate uridylyltransferase
MKVKDFHALEYEGATYDCGDPVGLLRANVAYALQHASLGEAARAAVTGLL